MNIDKLIDLFKETTEEVIIITNKETIDLFFNDIETPIDHVGFKINNPNDCRSIYRKGITIHFKLEYYDTTSKS